jgi:hypothetical protein
LVMRWALPPCPVKTACGTCSSPADSRCIRRSLATAS